MTRTRLLALCVLFASGCADIDVDDAALMDGSVTETGGTQGSGGGVTVVPPTGGGSSIGSGGVGTGGSVSSTTGGTSSGGTSSTGGSANTGGTVSTGGTVATGGASAGTGGADASGCTNLARDTGADNLGTGAVCFIVDLPSGANPMYGWRCDNCGDRTITINGQPAPTVGMVPWPGSSPYLVEISSGALAYAGFAWW